MKVLLSIKPEFANLIFEGKKKFEFRRSIFKKSGINTVVVYASFPVQKVIGEFEIELILNDNLQSLWQKTRKFAGIEEEFFYKYFDKKELGYAIKVKKTIRYKEPLCIREDFNLSPPQSFLYLH